MNKKVLFVATVTAHINAFHIPYLKWFKDNGYEVHVASNGNEKIEYCDKHFCLPFERIPWTIENVKAYKELKKVIHENKYEIIHCHTPVGGFLTRLAAKKSRKYGTKVIYTAHGFHFYKGAPVLNWLIYYPVEKLMAHYTDYLITINEEDYNIAKKKLKAKNVVFVNGVGVEKNKFDYKIAEEEKEEIRKELNIKKDDFVIIFPAELSKRKNQQMLIKAVSLIKQRGCNNIKVLLAGDGPLKEYYQNLVKELNVENEIKLLGKRKDIPKLLSVSNLLVSTSKQEGLPVNVMEAMFVGIPIIVTDCRGNRDLIKECIKIDDYEGLAKAIEVKMKTGKNENVKYNTQKYELDEILKKMEKVYCQ